MKREDKCISLELAKKINVKLIELGIDVPESEYYWVDRKINDYINRADRKVYEWINVPFYLSDCKITGKELEGDTDKPYTGTCIPAYDTSELGEMLPEHYFTQRHSVEWITCKDEGEEGNEYHLRHMPEKGYKLHEAEARGKMYLYLLESGYMGEK